MIKNFCDFVNESATDAQLDKAMLVIIYECLKRFDLQGGNSIMIDDDWNKIDSIFPEGESPDLFVNIDWRTDEPSVIGEAELLSNTPNKILDKRFHEYGLSIENLKADETIVHIADLKQDALYDKIHVSDEITTNVVDFYKKRESRIKELEEKLKTHLKGKKFGIS